jgi:hypothetical protein
MDDLFRSAAENYQLKAVEDWDKVAPFLSGQATTPAAAVKPANKKTRLIFALILILSPLLVTYYRYEKPEQTVPPIVSNNREAQSEVLKPGNSVDHSTKFSVPVARSQENSTQTTASTVNQDLTHSPTSRNPLIIDLLSLNPSMQTIERPHNRNIEILSKLTTEPYPPVVNSAPTAASIPVKKTPEVRGFYLGFNAGPQWNQVEGQGYNKTGFNLGLIGGFSFNNKLAVESGIAYSRKYYYSDGQYFHMKKNPGTPTMKVISLEGSSNVIEIPMKVKYDIIDKKKGELFVTSGISTYILTKENNQYYALINGSPQNANVIYKDKKIYLAGGLNLSAGYSIHLKKKTDIRIEPYMQIPFKGTGVGSMRVTTSGLNIGLTRTLR